ncbi:MAG: GDCCVxC domain-containing (seleno)protein [Pyrinomonadaceae bacterium]
MKRVNKESTISCPNCGHQSTETMPIDSCQFFYECAHCSTILRPKKGDCCVFCSYGNTKCPSIQLRSNASEKGEECC